MGRKINIDESAAVVLIERRHTGSSISGLEARISRLAEKHRVHLVTAGRPNALPACVGLWSFPAVPHLLSSFLFYATAPAGAALAARFTPVSRIICKSPFEAFGAALASKLVPARRRPQLEIEIHGDWRASSRLYGGPLRRIFAPVADSIARWSVLRADRVHAVNNYGAGLARAAGYAGPIQIFTPDTHARVFVREHPRPFGETPTATFIGNLAAVKGPDVLLEAWPVVKKALPAARLVLAVGDGRSRLNSLLAERRLSNVVALGRLERAQVRALLDATWTLVLPSRSEALPRVILEAFACGRPVIASNVGGIPDLVAQGTQGLLIAPGDPAALAQALIRLLTDIPRTELMGKEGFAKAKRLFADTAADSWLDALRPA